MAEDPQPPQPDDAMLDLLIKQITEGLSPEEQRELDVLDSAAASAALRELEHVAAAVTVAAASHTAPLPAALAAQVEQQARAHLASTAAGLTAGTATVSDLRAARDARAVSQAPRRPASMLYGWVAAAACLVIAVFGWLRAPTPPAPIAAVPSPPAVTQPVAPAAPPSLAEQYQALLAKGGTLKAMLGATKDPAAIGASGDLVWDPSTNRGFMHFTGLAANDPAVHEYQIWIFDAARDQRYPIDGGVFDVPANSNEVVIPIRAALAVLKPAAFAVTVEKPGGTVVSDRRHVVVLGKVG